MDTPTQIQECQDRQRATLGGQLDFAATELGKFLEVLKTDFWLYRLVLRFRPVTKTASRFLLLSIMLLLWVMGQG